MVGLNSPEEELIRRLIQCVLSPMRREGKGRKGEKKEKGREGKKRGRGRRDNNTIGGKGFGFWVWVLGLRFEVLGFGFGLGF